MYIGSSAAAKQQNDSAGGVVAAPSSETLQTDKERRQCRCMFCGQQLDLGSEEEAVDHMRVCVALQEQLSSKEQFTVPSMLREKMNGNVDLKSV
jgi:hypothetical protein